MLGPSLLSLSHCWKINKWQKLNCCHFYQLYVDIGEVFCTKRYSVFLQIKHIYIFLLKHSPTTASFLISRI